VDEIGKLLRLALGLGADDRQITMAQMALRAVVVYVVTVIIVRLGKKRFMGQGTAFDVILGIILGSIVSRAITGNAPFFPALAAAAVLVAMHWLLSGIALRWHGFGVAFKGHERLLVRDGRIDWATMRQAHMSERDLWEDLRGKGVSRLEQAAEARLERSGELSVIWARGEPKVVEIGVADGVQTVRVELG
jgi:uncharacterized membrane protein YcaP (DUF421 family)